MKKKLRGTSPADLHRLQSTGPVLICSDFGVSGPLNKSK